MGTFSAEENAGGPLVVLCEDDSLIRTLIVKILAKAGYRVESFASGFDGLAWFAHSSDRVSLLITDVNMPGMTGKALADEVCRLKPGTKILFITGFTHYQAHELNPCGSGDLNLLKKPFTPDTLLETVGNLVGSKDEPAEARQTPKD
jgi:FixJ family two-component response regulator